MRVRIVLFVCILLIVLLSLCVFVCAVEQNSPRIYLTKTVDPETELWIIKVFIELDDREMCGLELDLSYDSEKFKLCSVERLDALSELEFDCSLSSSRARLLFWGDKNSSTDGALVNVCFMPISQDLSGAKFSLSLPTDTSAIYLDDKEIRVFSPVISELVLPDVTEDSPTEIPTSDMPTEQITQASTEVITQDISQADSDEPSEDSSSLVPSQEPQDSITLVSKKIPRSVTFIPMSILSLLFTVSAIPLFMPKTFRKGYF